eukprot:1777098-Prymnesium_polylepis.1
MHSRGGREETHREPDTTALRQHERGCAHLGASDARHALGHRHARPLRSARLAPPAVIHPCEAAGQRKEQGRERP